MKIAMYCVGIIGELYLYQYYFIDFLYNTRKLKEQQNDRLKNCYCHFENHDVDAQRGSGQSDHVGFRMFLASVRRQ